VAPVCLCLILAILLLPSPLIAQQSGNGSTANSTRAETGTNTDEYLNQSLDTGVLSGEEEESQLNGNLQAQSSGSNLVWFFLKIGFGLGVVIGGIWLVSKVLQKSGMTGTDSELMGIRSTLPVGQNQYLQIVQVGSQYFMLGVTENQVTMLDELTDQDTIRSIRNEDQQSTTETQGFSDVIKNAIGMDDHEFNQQDSNDHLDELHQKIDDIRNEREPQS
jgi:flagellar protein FliO/FliZ